MSSDLNLLPGKETEALTYFNELLIEVKFVLRVVPRPFTAAIIASEMPAAMRPYSIAVAPDSSDKNFKRTRFTPASFNWSKMVDAAAIQQTI
jgi:hypothetical protein